MKIFASQSSYAALTTALPPKNSNLSTERERLTERRVEPQHARPGSQGWCSVLVHGRLGANTWVMKILLAQWETKK